MVEDEPTILELLSGSLRFAGFDVVTAATGTEALRAAARVRPDLILLDVMMPDGNGFDVLRQIRCGGPHVPVTFLTARGTLHDRVAGLTLGGDDYVTKPFSLDEVLARMRAVLRRSPDQAEDCRLAVADLERGLLLLARRDPAETGRPGIILCGLAGTVGHRDLTR